MEEYKQLMSRKLGLKEYNRELINKLLSNMAFDKVDYTNCFRALGNVKSSLDVTDEDLLKPIKCVLLETSKERRKAWIDWMKLYTQQVVVCFVIACAAQLCFLLILSKVAFPFLDPAC